jgi:hypothetical protein
VSGPVRVVTGKGQVEKGITSAIIQKIPRGKEAVIRRLGDERDPDSQLRGDRGNVHRTIVEVRGEVGAEVSVDL